MYIKLFAAICLPSKTDSVTISSLRLVGGEGRGGVRGGEGRGGEGRGGEGRGGEGRPNYDCSYPVCHCYNILSAYMWIVGEFLLIISRMNSWLKCSYLALMGPLTLLSSSIFLHSLCWL